MLDLARQNLHIFKNPRYRMFMEEALDEASMGKFSKLEYGLALREFPVGVEEFICSPYYLDMQETVYPVIMDELIELNNGDYVEAVLTGAIGTGKTTMALITTAYQLYQLSCIRSPHHLYKLDPAHEIVFIFQSINASLAKQVDYARFRATIEKSPYFNEKFMFRKDLESELRFPNRVIVKPVSGAATGAIGQNVIGGVIDELNFMQIVERSKQSDDGGGYDQAVAVYNSIARRRKSRFMKQGKMPGILCLVSSKRYPGQFTDQKMEEAQIEIDRTGKTSIFIYDKATWEVKPAGTFTGKWFKVYCGSESRKPRILETDEEYDELTDEDKALCREVPQEYRIEFEKDIMNALRDIAGVSTLARHPYMADREGIINVSRKGDKIFSQDVVDFVNTKLTIKKDFYKPELPRYVHIDLAISGDSAGMVIGTVKGFKSVPRGEYSEMLPDIWIDDVLEVAPPRGGEIQFYKIREVLYALKKMGLNIRWVTFDSFQSTDSIQLLRQAGFATGYLSMDTSNDPYDLTKAAIYDGRISYPRHPRLINELISLEKDTKRNKIDHPPHGSKDCSDSLAGVVYGLTMRREIWGLYGIQPVQIPESVWGVIKKIKEGKDEVKA